VVISDQTDGNAAGDARESLVTAMVIAPAAGGPTSYAYNTLGSADASDWCRIPGASGQIITATFNVLDFGSASSLVVHLRTPEATLLASDSVIKPDSESDALSWMSDNSSPSAYLLEVRVSPGPAIPLRYRFDVSIGQQDDGGALGDAGDTFDAVMVVVLSNIAPEFDAPSNLLGNADSSDFFLIKLPPQEPWEPPTPYRLCLDSIVWPAGTGTLPVDTYQALRDPISGMTKIINAPSSTPYSVDVTRCGSNGCYVKITTGFSASHRVQYAVRVLTPVVVQLPFILK
jgi:hypothetical protein